MTRMTSTASPSPRTTSRLLLQEPENTEGPGARRDPPAFGSFSPYPTYLGRIATKRPTYPFYARAPQLVRTALEPWFPGVTHGDCCSLAAGPPPAKSEVPRFWRLLRLDCGQTTGEERDAVVEAFTIGRTGPAVSGRVPYGPAGAARGRHEREGGRPTALHRMRALRHRTGRVRGCPGE